MESKRENIDIMLALGEEELQNLSQDLKEIRDLGEILATLHDDQAQFNMFKVQIARIDGMWDKFCTIFRNTKEYAKLCNVDRPSLDTLRQTTKAYWFEALSFQETLLPKVPPNTISTYNDGSLRASSVIHDDGSDPSIKLPAIQLPIFNGDLANWPTFRDIYASMIHKNNRLSVIQKFYYLRSSLQGPAIQAISSIPISSETYQQAWNCLQKRFDNKRVQATQYLDKIFSFKPLHRASLTSFQQLTEVVFENVNSLRNLNLEDEAGFILLAFIMRLLDPKTRESFDNLKTEVNRLPKLQDLVDFIHQQCIRLQTEPCTMIVPQGNAMKTNPETKRILYAQEQQISISEMCPVCNQHRHPLYKCQQFQSMEITQRINLTKELRVCYNCLSLTHFSKACKSKTSCRHCGRKHHSMLHVTTPSDAKPSIIKISSTHIPTSPGTFHTSEDVNQLNTTSNGIHGRHDTKLPSATKQSVLSSSSPQSSSVLLGTAIARMKGPHGQWETIRLVIDCGAQRSFITEDLAKRLRLSLSPNTHQLCGFGEVPINNGKYQTRCVLAPHSSPEPELITDAVVIPQISSAMPSNLLPNHIKEHFDKLNLADPSFCTPGDIDFLLGADLFGEIILGRKQSTPKNYPQALDTIFGWVVMGPLQHSVASTATALLANTLSEDDLREVLERFWSVEEAIPRKHVDPLEIECEEHFQRTYTRDSEGRYMVRLPFIKDPDPFVNSKSIGLKRFYRLEAKLNQQATLKEEYSQIVKEYLQLGYISRTSEPGRYYLPHHGVVKDSSTTKLRIVFDASVPTSQDGLSLNSQLHVGPKLQQDIKDILLAFRIHPFALTADVKQIFNKEDAVEEFQFNRVTFGMSCSPFLALRVIHQLVSDEGKAYPAASTALNQDLYIDDVLTGAATLEDGINLRDQLIALMSKGCFELRKWSSNCQSLLTGVPESKQTNVCLSNMEDRVVKVLGIQWNPTQDCLSYAVQPREFVATKRGMMSTIARMYDPLGYLAPVVFKAKTLLQQLWRLKLGWDEPVPMDIEREWYALFSQLSELQTAKIPRCLFPQVPCQTDLIGFADASDQGYAAVIYLRINFPSGSTSSRVIFAKTKLAPLKTMSIPRLELSAAGLLVKSIQSIKPFLSRISIDKTYLISDSTTVLSWLQTPSHKLKTFVANRVVAILEHTEITDWYHVPSAHNAADIASRGVGPSALLLSKDWWLGPTWLTKPTMEWPLKRHPISNMDLPEVKVQSALLITREVTSWILDLVDRISTFTILCRIVAFVLRFARNCRVNSEERTKGLLTLKELDRATTEIIKNIQHHYFPEGDTCQQKIMNLAPFKDEWGVLRVGGRLEHAPLSYNTRHPILLPGKTRFVALLIDYYHIVHLHAGPQQLHFLLRRHYWITSARQIIRSRTHKCLLCHRLRVKNYQPIMSSLPPSRFTQGRAFMRVGVDFAGPFMLRESIRRKAAIYKAYICIYICLSTKAVHVEVVSKLTTDAFLASLDRFISRRGLPKEILSDNGRNFIGAEARLKELTQWWKHNQTQDGVLTHLNIRGIHWTFIPPHAPHFGGLWEAGVKSLKYHLYRSLKYQPLTFEELATISSRVEAILNSRPLYPISSSPEDLDVLTPGHFLIGAPLVSRLEEDSTEISPNRLSRWQFLQRCIQDIWKRWRLDYLHHLQQRNKWPCQESNVKEGTLVLLREDKVPPLQWPIGRIQQCMPGKDGQVRVVKVRTAEGEFIRPVVKLSPLFPEGDNDDDYKI